MQNTFRHIIVWSLAGLLLLGQTGVNLHTIYCYCQGEWTSSIFVKATAECEEHPDAVPHGLPSCCQHLSECSLNAPGDHQLPCTEDVVVYLQSDQTAPPAQTDKWNVAAGWDLLAIIPNFEIFLLPSFENQTLTHPDFSPPVGMNGRAIRILVQSFLC